MNIILRYLADLLLRLLRSIDLPLLAALLALMGIGLATLYSASNESSRMLATQGTYFGIGLGMLWLVSRIPAHVLKQLTPPIYVASLLPLVLVLFVGSGKYGNHWINLGVFNFQPSELAKLTLPMMLAWHLDRNRLPPALSVLPMALLIIALPVGLILLQKDLTAAGAVGFSCGPAKDIVCGVWHMTQSLTSWREPPWAEMGLWQRLQAFAALMFAHFSVTGAASGLFMSERRTPCTRSRA